MPPRPVPWLDPARSVQAETLIPHAHPTPSGLKTNCDFRTQRMLKYPQRAEFHARAEWLHAGLLEGDPSVVSYIPQPLRLRVGERWYTPDCYIVYRDGRREVLELKPRGEFDEALRGPVTAFLAQHGLVFKVIGNESVYDRAVEAENWLEIVRILYLGRDLATEAAEPQVYAQVLQARALTLGEVIDAGDRADTYAAEIALFRLLHRGVLRAALTEAPLDWSTEVAPCA